MLRICSYNTKGFKYRNFNYLKSLFRDHDIMFIQETWLFDFESITISNVLPNSIFASTSAMDSSDVNRRGRPYGGCAIICKNNYSLTPIKTNTSRLCAASVLVNKIQYLILSVYMPVDDGASNSINCFLEILEEISALMLSHKDHKIIIGGDFNTDFSRNSLNTNILTSYLDYYSIRCSSLEFNCGIHTFESSAGNKSTIDHFLFFDDIGGMITCVDVLISGINLSDHNAVSMSINVDSLEFDEVPNVNKQIYSWNSITDDQKNIYKDTLNHYLNEIALCSDVFNCQDYFCNIHENFILAYFDQIIDSINISTEICIPKYNMQTKGKPGWNDYVKPFKNESMYLSRMWRIAGCPTQGDVYDARKEARKNYHSAVKYVKDNEDYIIKCNVAKKLAKKDSKNFWKEVNRIKKKNLSTCSTIDGIQGKTCICNLFKDKYKELYNEFDNNNNNGLFDRIDRLVENKCQAGGCSFQHIISIDDVKKVYLI